MYMHYRWQYLCLCMYMCVMLGTELRSNIHSSWYYLCILPFMAAEAREASPVAAIPSSITPPLREQQEEEGKGWGEKKDTEADDGWDSYIRGVQACEGGDTSEAIYHIR